jgi:NADH-quinone oxidoreductase subunit G
MATIIVDGKSYDVTDGQNLLHACLSAGLDLPYFCWHPAMGSVGACRQCAIIQYQDEDDSQGRLTMACMTPVRDGLRISLDASNAVEFRKSVIEWLMLNHPHDCPVCEEGGECHLQDMTVMTGHTFRRYAGNKRTFNNQYLGPFINHEMNRCITCYRCVRYYHDYAGGEDLQAFGSRDRMYFGRATDGVLESEFAGNLVEVCPTGVFTDKPFSASYTRKWDLQSAPSICGSCAVGCNILPGERYGRLKRVHNRYHGELNGYFLCDRGRFGADFVNSDRRFYQAGEKTDEGSFVALDNDGAIRRFVTALDGGDVIGIGSPRASVEANFALRALVGPDRFCNGMSTAETNLVDHALGMLRNGPARVPTLKDVEQADAVLILGEDLSNTAPRVALALRQAARNEALNMAPPAGIPTWQDAGVRGHAQDAMSPIFSATPLRTRIDDIATRALHVSSERISRLGFHIAAALNPDYPAGAELNEIDSAFVRDAAGALSAAQRPLIVSGTGAASTSVLEAAANVAWALCNAGKSAGLMLNVPEANSFGTAMLGTQPSLDDALDMLGQGVARTVIILENDLFRRADRTRVETALRQSNTVIALDSLENETVEHADLVLPAATFAECEGTYVNYETRAQRFYQVFLPKGDVKPAWRWISDAARSAGRTDLDWDHIDDLIADCANAVDAFSGLSGAGPKAGFRGPGNTRIPRQPHRYSGRTAMNAAVNIHEPKAPRDEESPFAYSMEGANQTATAALMPYSWSPGWNSNQSVMKYQQEIGGHLHGGDPGVRLIERGATLPDMMRFSPPTADTPAHEGLLPLAVFEVFGSDELSSEAAAIAQRIPAAYVILHPEDAAALGVEAGAGVRDPASSARFAVRVDPDVPPGHVYYGRGLPGGWSNPPTTVVVLERDPEYQPPPDHNLIARS